LAVIRLSSAKRAPRAKVLAANVYHPPRKGYQQDAPFAASKVELRGDHKVIRSFRAVTKSKRRKRSIVLDQNQQFARRQNHLRESPSSAKPL
jgi:hypothetical protein